MLISIIIPVYNVEDFLPECLQMILNQTYKKFELILVDDGSTDKSGVICDEFAKNDKRISVIHKLNEGQAVARNIGHQNVKGEYTIFLDADDKWCDINFLENLHNKAKQENADVVLLKMCRWINGEVLPSKSYTDSMFNGEPAVVVEKLLKSQMFHLSSCSKLVRTDVLLNNNICFPEGKKGEDMDWNLQLWLHLKSISYTNSSIYLYRMRPGSTTNTYSTKNSDDFCWILNKWQNLAMRLGDEWQKVYHMILADLYVTLVYNYCIIPTNERKQSKNDILNLVSLLDNAATKKSCRLRLMRNLLGKNIMLRFAGVLTRRK